MSDKFVLVHVDGYKKRELAEADSIGRIAQMAAEKAGERIVPDGGETTDGNS